MKEKPKIKNKKKQKNRGGKNLDMYLVKWKPSVIVSLEHGTYLRQCFTIDL